MSMIDMLLAFAAVVLFGLLLGMGIEAVLARIERREHHSDTPS